jgi:hypothetical protein
VLRIFIALKNPSPWQGSKPQPLGPLTTTPPRDKVSKTACTTSPLEYNQMHILTTTFTACISTRFLDLHSGDPRLLNPSLERSYLEVLMVLLSLSRKISRIIVIAHNLFLPESFEFNFSHSSHNSLRTIRVWKPCQTAYCTQPETTLSPNFKVW